MVEGIGGIKKIPSYTDGLGGVAGTLSADLYTALLCRGEDGAAYSWSGGYHSNLPDYRFVTAFAVMYGVCVCVCAVT